MSDGRGWRRKGRRILFVVAFPFWLWVPASVAVAAPPAPFVMGTNTDEATFSGKWVRRIYGEVFRRLDIPLEVVVSPTKRLSAQVDAGIVDGEFLRVYDYAAAHPNLLRVDESVFSVVFALFAANPALRLNRLEDLAASGLIGEYRRGVGICEDTLKPLLPAERLTDVSTTDQGLKKLLAKRSDFLCDNDVVVQTELLSGEFRGVTTIRKLIDLGQPHALYPYLHKKHASLAPRLAATIKAMKAEGLIERYRLEAARATEP